MHALVRSCSSNSNVLLLSNSTAYSCLACCQHTTDIGCAVLLLHLADCCVGAGWHAEEERGGDSQPLLAAAAAAVTSIHAAAAAKCGCAGSRHCSGRKEAALAVDSCTPAVVDRDFTVQALQRPQRSCTSGARRCGPVDLSQVAKPRSTDSLKQVCRTVLGCGLAVCTDVYIM